ncbi:MAG: hypothetical protein P4M05_36160 [Bradyrhizobium sp.]|nr:hypothetical protein [Bradyrhizobium sp.]
MFVVELFLPLDMPDGTAIPGSTFDRIKAELTFRFGGITAFLKSPADGAWQASSRAIVHDRVAVFEIMVDNVDVEWWRAYRQKLEAELNQQEVLARLYQVTKL